MCEKKNRDARHKDGASKSAVPFTLGGGKMLDCYVCEVSTYKMDKAYVCPSCGMITPYEWYGDVIDDFEYDEILEP